MRNPEHNDAGASIEAPTKTQFQIEKSQKESRRPLFSEARYCPHGAQE